MAVTRRQFMAASVASAATLASTQAMGADMHASTGKLVHNVYFWLKNPDSKADRDALVAGLNTLKTIPSVKELHIGLPANTEKRDVVDNSFSVSELMYFDSVEGQNAYQVHPVHNAFVEKFAHLWEKVVVHDSIVL
jgi:hypothetical protein